MSTRDRMVDAAAYVMRTRGLARATTKEIAKEAGFSEAALYKHFRDKTDLFLAVLNERVPSDFGVVLAGLAGLVGREPLAEVLERVARTAIAYYRETFPMAASLYSEPQLLAAHRKALLERGAGPHRPRAALAGYLAAEQALGRLHPDADPVAAAQLLLGGCLQTAFLATFAAEPEPVDLPLVRTLVTGLNPP
ncbi:TetR/AcrR family transcriptional regulator [Fodinicola feengrottensis]|uniref:TetR/AcrR family transcriptional regulator n=1 Tax=Fodinicola feengrottensis TaxID=435914 RepID=A0ABP4SLM8_9ACTN|nr:TetR/AcrR family transcriptional regulator [Fodinicola feengrottensis]